MGDSNKDISVMVIGAGMDGPAAPGPLPQFKLKTNSLSGSGGRLIAQGLRKVNITSDSLQVQRVPEQTTNLDV